MYIYIFNYIYTLYTHISKNHKFPMKIPISRRSWSLQWINIQVPQPTPQPSASSVFFAARRDQRWGLRGFQLGVATPKRRFVNDGS